MIPFDSIRTNGYPPLQSFFLISCRSRSLSRLNKLQCSSIRRNRNLLCRFDTRQSRDNHRHVIHLSSVSKVFRLILKSKGDGEYVNNGAFQTLFLKIFDKNDFGLIFDDKSDDMVKISKFKFFRILRNKV